MTEAAELVADLRCGTGESPVWRVAEAALYWVDIPGREVHRWTAADQRIDSWAMDEMPACMANLQGERWLIAMESGVFAVELQDDCGSLQSMVAPVQHPAAGMRFNDGRCDRQGRFWGGTMVMDMSLARNHGSIYRLQDSGKLQAVLNDFIVPNGMAFSPDGKTMYLSDSHPSVQKIWAFDYDTELGLPSNRRLFVDMNAFPGRPDGAAVDADGCYWICGNDAGLVHRFTPQGRLDRSLAVPVKKPAMCAFGGAALDTLFVTSIRPSGIDLSDQPLAGAVFAIRPGVRGLEEPGCSQGIRSLQVHMPQAKSPHTSTQGEIA